MNPFDRTHKLIEYTTVIDTKQVTRTGYRFTLGGLYYYIDDHTFILAGPAIIAQEFGFISYVWAVLLLTKTSIKIPHRYDMYPRDYHDGLISLRVLAQKLDVPVSAMRDSPLYTELFDMPRLEKHFGVTPRIFL